MTAFDERDAHSLVCIQSNRGVPQASQECVCRPRLPRTYRPTFEVEGPHIRSPRRAMLFGALIALAIVALWALSFVAGVLSAKGVFS